MKKKILITLTFTIFLITVFSTVYANGINPVGIVNDPSDDGVKTLYSLGNNIISIFQVVGVGMALVALIVLGIRYMYSSPNEKAEIKNKLIPFVIGGTLLFGAATLINLVEGFINAIPDPK